MSFKSTDRVLNIPRSAEEPLRIGTIMRLALPLAGPEPVAYVLWDDSNIYGEPERMPFSEIMLDPEGA